MTRSSSPRRTLPLPPAKSRPIGRPAPSRSEATAGGTPAGSTVGSRRVRMRRGRRGGGEDGTAGGGGGRAEARGGPPRVGATPPPRDSRGGGTPAKGRIG